jgi:hypothetical protein
MAVDDVYQLTVTAQGSAGFFQNTLAFSMIDAANPTPATAAVLASDWKEVHRAAQHTSIIYRSWRLRQVRGTGVVWPTGSSCQPEGGLLIEGNFTTSNAGGAPLDILPSQCAMVVTLKTGQIGRRKRGRVYVYGFTEDGTSGGTWSSAHLAAMETAWGTFMGKYSPGSAGNHFQLGVWSFRTASGCEPNPDRKVGGHIRVDPPAPLVAYTPVQTHVIRNVVYTQRRRVTGVGR